MPKVFEVTRQTVIYDTFFQTFGKFFIADEYTSVNVRKTTADSK